MNMSRKSGLCALWPCLVLLAACGRDASPPSAPQGAVSEPTPAPAPAAPSAPPQREEKKVEIASYEDVLKLFDELGYTPEAWQAGVRVVPRVYIAEIPQRWREKTVNEVAVLTKKQLFFRAMGPLILRANELILADRERVQAVAKTVAAGGPVAPADRDWVLPLAVRYGVAESADAALDAALLNALLERVDVVPPALALAQAAEESGWGTSRFAAEGNALFGQWSWGKQGIKPEQHRAALGDYGIAAFESPLQSVLAYMNNLNTHDAYAGLRAKRAELRKAGQVPTGRELSETLDKYSERGEAYVDSLQSLMTTNRLDPTDQAYLGDGPTIYLIAAGEGTAAGTN
jgi:uncharacterized FlgJ-related protein